MSYRSASPTGSCGSDPCRTARTRCVCIERQARAAEAAADSRNGSKTCQPAQEAPLDRLRRCGTDVKLCAHVVVRFPVSRKQNVLYRHHLRRRRGRSSSRQLGLAAAWEQQQAERETAYICMLQEPQESQLAYDAQRVLPNLEHPIDVLNGHLFVALRAAAPSPAINQTRVSANTDGARATTRSPGQPATPPKPIRGGEAIPCRA